MVLAYDLLNWSTFICVVHISLHHLKTYWIYINHVCYPILNHHQFYDKIAASSEVSKLQQHLTLLKEEYTKLQSHCAELEKKYNLAAASSGDLSETSFIARLLMTVTSLYKRELYSDIKIKLQTSTLPAHKFVLNARSDDFNEEALKKINELG